MKKRLLSLLLALTMCLSLSVPVWGEVLDPSFDDKYNYLLSNGFPESFLDDLDEYSIDYLYDESQENYLVYGGSVAPGPEASNMAPFAFVNPDIAPTAVTDGTFSMTSHHVIAYAENHVDVNYYTIFVNYEWTSPTTFCVEDGFVSNWPSEHLTYRSGTFRYRPYYKTTSATSWTLDTTNQTSTPDTLVQGGLGIVFDLKSSSNQNYMHKGTFYYSLNKVLPNSDGINVTVNSIYAHKCLETSMEITLSVDGPSVTFVPGAYYQHQATSVSFQF